MHHRTSKKSVSFVGVEFNVVGYTTKANSTTNNKLVNLNISTELEKVLSCRA